MAYAIARPANVYGPRQSTGVEGAVVAGFVERLRDGVPVVIHGNGEQQRDFVYVADVVSAILLMLGSERDGIWNVGSGRATTVAELLDLLQRVIRPAVEIRRTPARPGDVFLSRLSIEKIVGELGWRPRYDLASGIDRLLEEESAGLVGRRQV